MKTTGELLDLAKLCNGECSDYRLAQLLGIQKSGISNYRNGRSFPSNAISARLATLCALDPAVVVCWVNLERAESVADLETWQMMLARVAPLGSPHLARLHA